MSDRYLEHCMAVLRRSKEEAEDGVSCVLSVPEVDCIIDLLKEQKEETTFVLGGYYEPTCEKCGFRPFAGYIPTIEWMKQHGYKSCPHCGRKVKWNADK